MSDESDETRRFSPGDAEGSSSESGKPGKPASDATQVDGTPPEIPVGRAPVPPPTDQDTFPGSGSREDDDTLDGVRRLPPIRDEPTVIAGTPASTSVMPPVEDDWAPSRANPAWSGRAEVRAPQPGRGYPEVDWTASAPPQQRDRWWMPILVGVIALILLAVLGWAIYLIVEDSSGDETPAPVTSSSVTPTEPTTIETTSPSATPSTISPSPSTTDPTSAEVTIPALRGLALPAAQAALRKTGLPYRLIFRQAADAPPGTVIDSDPVEGQVVPPDTTVTLVVAADATTPTQTTGPADQPGAGN